MLDDKDIEKLKAVLSTKEDFNILSTQLETAKKEIKEDVDGLREMVQSLVVSVDKLVGAVADLKQEYTMVSAQITRHEKWIQQLADKLGIKLEH